MKAGARRSRVAVSAIGVVAVLLVLAPAAVAAPGSISGHVTNSANAPLEGVCVIPVAQTSGLDNPAQVRTDANGNFLIADVAPGSYRMRFSACDAGNYVNEWYDNAPDFQSATTFTVGDGQPVVLNDVALATGGAISGRVTAEGGSQGLQYICVSANQPGVPSFIDGITTGPDGTYTLPGLSPGSNYVVSFNPCPGAGDYGWEFYDNVHTVGQAKRVTVTAGQTTPDIDAALGPGTHLTGRVTDAAGNPLAGACASVTATSGGGSTGVQTDSNGYYRFDYVEPGTYHVSFQGCAAGDYAIQYYSGASEQSQATPVTVVRGQTTADINGALKRPTKLKGTVTNLVGDPLAGACVRAHRTGAVGPPLTTLTGADGSYSFAGPGLVPGEYRVSFEGCNAGSFVSEYYEDAADAASADPVTVSADQITEGIDAALAPGASISGTVTGPTGQPLNGACVRIYPASANADPAGYGQGISLTIAGSGGAYKVQSLPAGAYKVQFGACFSGDFASEFYEDAESLANADPVILASGQDLTGINAQLTAGGRLGGRLTNGADPLGSVCVGLYDAASGNLVDATRSGGDGNYFFLGLRPGGYKLGYALQGCPHAPATALVTEYFSNRASLGSADVVQVQAGTTVSGVDAILSPPDSVAPETTISSAPFGSTNATAAAFAFFSDERGARFECALDGGAFTPCASPRSFGGLTEGGHTFAVRAVDAAENVDPTPATRSWAVDSGSATQTSSGTAEPGGTVGTDPAGVGPTATQPVTTAVTTPSGGAVTITETRGAPPSTPTGYSVFGQAVVIEAPPASVGAPLQITFVVHASAIDAGTDLGTVTVLRDGRPAGDCLGSSVAVPDPCITARASLAGGDLRLTVLTSHASKWNFATRPKPSPPARCVVPKLAGKRLPAVRTALRRAHCRLGAVKRRRSAKRLRGRVIAQSPKPRAVRPKNTKVRVTLGRR